jgi:glutamate synthase (NADPH/NADH) large chain
VLDLDPAEGRAQGPPAAGPDVPRRHRAGRIIERRRGQGGARRRAPTTSGCTPGMIDLDDLPEREHIVHTAKSVARRQQTFGYTEEELRILLAPMARTGGEALGSMGTDTPIAVLSSAAAAVRLLHPAVRPGDQPAAGRDPRGARHLARHARSARRATCSEADPGALPPGRPAVPGHRQRRAGQDRHGSTPTATCPATPRRRQGLYRRHGGAAALARRGSSRSSGGLGRHRRGAAVRRALRPGLHRDLAPIPSLLLTGGAPPPGAGEDPHPGGPVVEAGDVREVHHVALLIGYGAAAVNPYLAMETVEDMVRPRGTDRRRPEKAVANLIKALGKGVLKVMSKMGISTVASYCGAQVFEAIGLSQEFVDRYFTGTVQARRHRARRRSPKPSRRRGTPSAYPPEGSSPAHRTLGSAASTSGAARASRTCSTPRRSSGCSTPPAAALRHLQAVHRAGRRPGASG